MAGRPPGKIPGDATDKRSAVEHPGNKDPLAALELDPRSERKPAVGDKQVPFGNHPLTGGKHERAFAIESGHSRPRRTRFLSARPDTSRASNRDAGQQGEQEDCQANEPFHHSCVARKKIPAESAERPAGKPPLTSALGHPRYMEGWNAIAAHQALDAACSARKIAADRTEMIQFAKSAVYRISTDLVARVSPPGSDLANIEAGRQLAGWLDQAGFPVAPPAIDIAPVQVGKSSVSFWRWRGPARPVSPEEMADLLAGFHQVTDRYRAVLPELDPTRTAADRLLHLEAQGLIGDADIEVLWAWQRHLQSRLRLASSVLGRGVIHGNAHKSNAWAAPDGPLLLDFDRVARGPREWDLLVESVDPRRFARDRSFYERLLARYGFPVTSWPGFTDAALSQELLLTLARIELDGRGTRTEAERRMAYWRGDPRPPVWRGF